MRATPLLSGHQPFGAGTHLSVRVDTKQDCLQDWQTAWYFVPLLRRGDWCSGVIWCWKGEAELVKPTATGHLESQRALGATLTPWHAQR